ncbi:MAG: 4'-phosphopantetheinyl transferase superfamily protein [Deltaproteobacteria bacterium]|jgi:phosphopantetheinyl transferase|nr:4'-phosphopantetheinyl transferase superfamily protein [Deltaproteobacteria bacterium]
MSEFPFQSASLDKIDIYLTPAPDPALKERFWAAQSLLPPSRQKKIARYRRPADQARSLAAGLLLWRFLGVRADGDLTVGPFGQPRLTKGGPCLSLSHSGGLAGLAVSPEPLGLDLERDQPELNWARLAQRILTPRERERLSQWPNPREFTLAAWTLKESLAKATGRGLTEELWSVEPLETFGRVTIQGQVWLLGHRLALNHHVAICVAQGSQPRFWLAESLAQNPRVTPLPTQKLFELAL